MVEKYLPYRGDVKAAVGVGSTVMFVTLHPEQQPTCLYHLHAQDLTVESEPLPCGALALIADDDTIWIAGSDKQIYCRSPKDKKPKAMKVELETAATALALLSEDRLAALMGEQIAVLSRKDGKLLQTLELCARGTAMASDPTQQWLAAGTDKGTVLVFQGEEQPEFLLSESDKLHEGGVTALLYEPEELRFFSAGLDEKLLVTHARGKLEPEDRGRGAGHEDRVTAMVLGLEDRFYTGSRDGTVKTWLRSGGQRPATQRDGVGKVVDLTQVEIHGRPHLVVACEDNSFCLFLLDPSGKIGQLVHKISDAYALAAHELSQTDPTRREAALKTLAAYNDTLSIDTIAGCAKKDSDHALRLTATQLLGESGHARASALLQKLLEHSDEAVRREALKGLRKLHGEEDLQPMDWALKIGKADIGVAAVEALRDLSKKDDQALARLKQTLNRKPPEVRRAGMGCLESVFDVESPGANLIGLRSDHGDIRRLALVRLMQRKMLGSPEVQGALRRCLEDRDADVRRTAFLVSLFTRDKLVAAIRARDADLHRQLHELETSTFERVTEGGKGKPAEAKKEPAKVPKPRKTKLNLDEDDHVPLLQAMASRAVDTCLLGGRCLALLGDARAFGLLLQLSREDDAKTRVEVCQALAALDDPRSLERLATLLHDEAAEVRDAAFTALSQILQKEPLKAVEYGLGAGFEDVRRRGLQVLIRDVRKKTPKKAGEPSWDLLVRALNDSAAAVRSEAFKAALSAEVAGGGEATLRFVLASVHEDVRREVLTESMAQYREPWAAALLLEFFNDSSAVLRSEALEFAGKRAKGRDVGFLEQAVASRYADLREQAVAALAKKHTPAAQALLAKAVDDEERKVRTKALASILDANAEDALAQALASEHVDVRLGAAVARAKQGDPAALEPLLAIATEEGPDEASLRKAWLSNVELALEGLGALGDASVLDRVLPLLETTHSGIRQAAAVALTGIAISDQADNLRAVLHHEDEQVKYRAALALAYAGDVSSAPLVFSKEAGKVLDERTRLAGAVTLGSAGEDFIISLLDGDVESLRKAALIVLMCLELKTPGAAPRRALACLSSRMPRVRLEGARALQQFADPAAMLELLTEMINERGQQPPWSISVESVEEFANLVAHGNGQVQARTIELLRQLDDEKQDGWDLQWAAHTARFADEVTQAEKQAKKQKTVKSEYAPEQLDQLAFGAYVGIVREQGGSPRFTVQVVRVRQTAISRLLAMAKTDDAYRVASVPVLVQALGDPNQVIRFQAFEGLKEFEVDAATLGAEALQCGHTDLGVAGLKLLAEVASDKEGNVIRRAVRTRTDDLALEAAKLLLETDGAVALAPDALEAANQSVREQAVHWLSEDYDKQKKAQTELRKALKSRYQHVRRAAAAALALKKDKAAFDALVEFLQLQQKNYQTQAIHAMEKLGDARVPDALLDRLVDDPSGTAQTDRILQVVGNYRRPEDIDRLLELMEKEKWQRQCFRAIRTISGHDQSIEDPEDEMPDRSWEEKQHPRHDGVLARLMEKGISLGMTVQLLMVVDAARWARGRETDAPLATLTGHPDDRLRHEAVQAVGWRLKKRKGPADPLIAALEHKDGSTKFYAAEGLAKAGRDEGISVLLAAVDLMSEVNLRSRAVSALGELADERALDTLLRLANEDGHALQEAAAEAIGHLGKSDKADEIFKLLERLSKGQGGIAENALRGLRWFDTYEGWQLVCKRAQDRNFWQRETAVELLGYHDDAGTRDLLLKIIAEEDAVCVVESAILSARRLWDDEALEPDCAVVKNSSVFDDLTSGERALERVCECGEPKQIFEILSDCSGEVRGQLFVALLARVPLPLKEAAEALESNRAIPVQIAAHILGRTEKAAAKPHLKALEETIVRWRDTWSERRARMLQENSNDLLLATRITTCVRMLVWAAGRISASSKLLIDVLQAWPDDPLYRDIRYEAISALSAGKASKVVLDALEPIVDGNDHELRAIAAAVLATSDLERAAGLPDRTLADRASFDRLARARPDETAAAIKSALSESHYQSVALPHAIDQADVESLAGVMTNAELPEAVRLGALEGLSKIASEDAEGKLIDFGSQEEDEELRKAAWRAVRRSKRARQKLAGAATGK